MKKPRISTGQHNQIRTLKKKIPRENRSHGENLFSNMEELRLMEKLMKEKNPSIATGTDNQLNYLFGDLECTSEYRKYRNLRQEKNRTLLNR